MARAQAFCRGHTFMPAEGQTLGRPVQATLVGPTGFTLSFRRRNPNAPDEPDTASGPP